VKAIIEDRGRQYLVDGGETILVDYLKGAEPGSEHVFDKVLMLGDDVGTPHVAGASVKSEVVGHVKGPKIVVQKFKRRKDYRRKQGHRQNFTRVTISKISK
jgi:large subunit ribosomal protein L21